MRAQTGGMVLGLQVLLIKYLRDEIKNWKQNYSYALYAYVIRTEGRARGAREKF